MRAVIYVKAETQEKAKEQLDMLKKTHYLKDKEWELVGVYVDVGIGRAVEMSGFKKLKFDLANYDVVIVWNIVDIFQTVHDYYDFGQDYADFYNVKDGMNTLCATARFCMAMRIMMAEYEQRGNDYGMKWGQHRA